MTIFIKNIHHSFIAESLNKSVFSAESVMSRICNFQVKNAKCQMPSANNHVPGIWDLAFDSWHLNLLPLLLKVATIFYFLKHHNSLTKNLLLETDRCLMQFLAVIPFDFIN
jgi:hypothetical protein